MKQIPEGLITESDIIEKVVSKNILASEITIGQGNDQKPHNDRPWQ